MNRSATLSLALLVGAALGWLGNQRAAHPSPRHPAPDFTADIAVRRGMDGGSVLRPHYLVVNGRGQKISPQPEVPADSWTIALDGGRVQILCTHADASARTASAPENEK